MHKYHLFTRFFIVVISLFCLGGQAFADDEPDYFEYMDDSKTVITGLKESGWAQTSLTIPASVTTVGRYAFYGNNVLSNLYIEGNPTFEIDDYEESALTDVKGTLNMIDLGTNMSLDKIKELLLDGYGPNSGTLEDIVIQSYFNTSTEVSNGPVVWGGRDEYGVVIADAINQVLTPNVRVILPAEIVNEQVFGLAEVWGRFNLTAKLFTFSGVANFYDYDDGSNWLFYVPTELHKEDKELYFKRVKIIAKNEGVLVHNARNTSGYVTLPRANEGDTYTDRLNPQDYEESKQKVVEIYAQNMLVGVTCPEEQTISETDGDKTNFILYHGMFYPTSGGTMGLNRAYLQILTEDYTYMRNHQGNSQDVNLSIVFETADAIHEIQPTLPQSHSDAWFTIDGRKLSTRPTLPGIYMHGGKKVVIRL